MIVARVKRLAGSLVVANLCAQVVNVAVLVALTRVVLPDNFAAFQLVVSVALIVTPLLSGAIEVTMVTARNPTAGRYLGRVVARRSLVASTVVTLVGAAAVVAGHERSGYLCIWSSVVTLGTVLAAVEAGWLTRYQRVSALGARAMASGFLFAIAEAVGIWGINGSFHILCAGLAVSRFGPMLIARRSVSDLWMGDSAADASAPRRDAAWSLAVVLSNVAVQAPVFGVTLISGVQGIANFALATRIAGLPPALLGTGLAQLVTVEIARASSESLIARLVRRIAIVGLLLGLVTAAGAVAVGPFVIGPAYHGALIYLAILAVPFSGQLVVRAAMPLYAAARATRVLLAIQIARVAAIGCVVFFAWAIGQGLTSFCVEIALVTAASLIAVTAVRPKMTLAGVAA